MKNGKLLFLFLIVLNTGCNTLYNNHRVKLEIMEPAKVFFSGDYKKLAIKYNNINVSYNERFASYLIDTAQFADYTNLDSSASFTFYDSFLKNIKSQHFFENITDLPKSIWSNFTFNDSLLQKAVQPDSISTKNQNNQLHALDAFQTFLNIHSTSGKGDNATLIDPEFGLWSRSELQKIADSTQADLLISLDFFASMDGITLQKFNSRGIEAALSIDCWSFYDLKKLEYQNFYERIDTTTWQINGAYDLAYAKKHLPPRKEAVLKAAELSAINFVHFLVPHWIQVERLYYQSGQFELKQAEKFVEEGNWLEAAKIWKKNIDNPNKNIAAKCTFNLGLACEIEGDIDAAIDWVVKSFHILENKNDVHSFHCRDYIQILAQRKLDFSKLDKQIN